MVAAENVALVQRETQDTKDGLHSLLTIEFMNSPTLHKRPPQPL